MENYVSLGTSGIMKEYDIVSNGEGSCEELYKYYLKESTVHFR